MSYVNDMTYVYRLYALYELCKLYEFFMNRMKNRMKSIEFALNIIFFVFKIFQKIFVNI